MRQPLNYWFQNDLEKVSGREIGVINPHTAQRPTFHEATDGDTIDAFDGFGMIRYSRGLTFVLLHRLR
jgi:hypothetical protein